MLGDCVLLGSFFFLLLLFFFLFFFFILCFVREGVLYFVFCWGWGVSLFCVLLGRGLLFFLFLCVLLGRGSFVFCGGGGGGRVFILFC